jgi:hypothetical protein
LGGTFCAMTPVIGDARQDNASANDASVFFMMRVLGNP